MGLIIRKMHPEMNNKYIFHHAIIDCVQFVQM